jgi:hypothetical protein
VAVTDVLLYEETEMAVPLTPLSFTVGTDVQVVPEPAHRAVPMIVIEVGAPDVECVVRTDVISGVAIATPEPASNRPTILQRAPANRNRAVIVVP